MKKVLYVIVSVITLASCTTPEKESSPAENESLSVVEKYLTAVQSKDISGMDSLLADNFMGYGPSFADSIDKASALKNWTVIADTYYDEIKLSSPAVIGSTVTSGKNPGNYVSTWSEVTLTYKDTARKPITTYANVVYKVENGKITMARRFYNEADIMRQAGYSLVPGQ